MTVSDASQLCAAKRTDCVLVVDQEEGLSGIFTAKDLAFRVSFPFPLFISPSVHIFC
jgi:CBS domain-containing protein